MPEPSPSQDTEPRVIQRQGPEPHLIYGNLARSDQPLMVEPVRSSSISTFAFVGIFVFILAGGLIAWIYFAEVKPEQRKALIEVSGWKQATDFKKTVPVFPDMLRVSSIAMGKIHLAIVNGTRLAEGDWLNVNTSQGAAAVQVEKIEDGLVHFRNGRVTINVKLTPSAKAKDSH